MLFNLLIIIFTNCLLNREDIPMVHSSKMYSGKNLSPLPLSQPPYFLSWDTTYVFSFLHILSARVDTYRIKYIYIHIHMYKHFFLSQLSLFKKTKWQCILHTSFSSLPSLLNIHPVGLSISVPLTFLWLHSTPLCGYVVIYLISPLLVDSWVVLNFLLL